MKFIKTKKAKKSSPLYSGTKKDEDTGNTELPSWATTDPDQFREQAAAQKNANNRTPELWVKDGEPRKVRFLDETPIVSFEVYNIRTANGRWMKIVRPAPGTKDLIGQLPKQRPKRVFVYRVIDREGYTKKDGTQVKNVARFFTVPGKLYEQINMVAEQLQSLGRSLTGCTIIISRTGTGQQTAYSLMPMEDAPMSSGAKRSAEEFPDWQDFYKPATVAEQKAIISGGIAREDSED